MRLEEAAPNPHHSFPVYMATVATSSLVAAPTASGSRAIELLLLLLPADGQLV